MIIFASIGLLLKRYYVNMIPGVKLHVYCHSVHMNTVRDKDFLVHDQFFISSFVNNAKVPFRGKDRNWRRLAFSLQQRRDNVELHHREGAHYIGSWTWAVLVMQIRGLQLTPFLRLSLAVLPTNPNKPQLRRSASPVRYLAQEPRLHPKN